jgi:hypothetical protein
MKQCKAITQDDENRVRKVRTAEFVCPANQAQTEAQNGREYSQEQGERRIESPSQTD